MKQKILAAILLLGLSGPALAQGQNAPVNLYWFSTVWVPVSSSNPLPVTGSFTQTAATPISCSALCANLVVKNAAGTLYSFEVAADSTLSGAAWWIMIYNATSAPGDGSVTPIKCYAAPSGATNFSGAFNTGGIALSTGITIGVSTNGCFTKAASTHALISADYQ